MYFIINILQTIFKDENQWYSTFINVIFLKLFTTRNTWHCIELEDTKGVIWSHESKDRQHNGQKKKDKRQEEFEDTKGVIRSHQSNQKDWQCNGQKKMTTVQTTIYKTLHRKQEIEQHESH
jgi:hypothetical protein